MKEFTASCVLTVLVGLALVAGRVEAGETLFSSNFTDLSDNWEVVDVPEARGAPGSWHSGLTEFSGIRSQGNSPATMLLAGKQDWHNYSVETSLQRASWGRNLIGIICGYQDPENYYLLGYNFDQRRFEFGVRTPLGFELLDFLKIDFPEKAEILLRLDYAGARLRLSANGRVIFDMNDGRYPSGRFGIGSAGLTGSAILIGPVTVKSLDPSKLPPRDMQDLLLLSQEGKVVSDTEAHKFGMLIDRSSLSLNRENIGRPFSLNIEENLLPVEGVFAFPRQQTVEIHNIGLQFDTRNFPKEIEFMVSEIDQNSGFRSLGTFQVRPEKDSYQEFAFNPVKAKFLKFRILSTHDSGKKHVEIREMFVKGYREGSGPGVGSVAAPSEDEEEKILFTDDFSSGNLDKWEVWNDPGADKQESHWSMAVSEFSGIINDLGYPATFLLAGRTGWADYSVQTNLYAVLSEGNFFGLVFGFHDLEHYYVTGYDFKLKRFELGVQTPDGFETLARATIDFPRSGLFPLQVNAYGNRIIVRFDDKVLFDIDTGEPVSGRAGIATSGIARGAVSFADFRIESLKGVAPPQRELQDLLSSRLGAAVIYRETLPKGLDFANLLDHQLLVDDDFQSSYNLYLSRDPLPQEGVFCFPQGRFAEIHRIGFKLGPHNFPKEVKFWVSNQTPKSGFSPLATLILQPEPDSYQEFEIPPTKAKYLKMKITGGTDSANLVMEEILVKGFFPEMGDHGTGVGKLDEVQVREQEANDSKKLAQPLPLYTYLGGRVSGKDVDFYKLSLSEQQGNTLTLQLDTIGMMRPGYALMTEEGTVVQPLREAAAANTTEITFDVAPADYFLRIDRPESWLTIVFDDSGSMKSSLKIVKEILSGYLDNLGEGLNLQLMKYTDQPDFLSDFTHDASILKQALQTGVKGSGGTKTYSGLSAAVESVGKQKGNRAVLAIFDDISSMTLQDYIDLWNAILDSGISFSTIAVDDKWEQNSFFNNSRQRIFKEIAFASSGQFYFSPTEQKVKESADIIFRQLTSPVEYRVRAALSQIEKKPGSLTIGFDKGEEGKSARNVELILDASNSMWGQIQGEAKIAIAKTVLGRIINGLPEEMNVGLRVYGHRHGLKDSRACADTELAVPINPLNKPLLTDTVNTVTPRGKTPLVHSVLQSIKDFEGLAGGTAILISDGIESCEGDIASIATAIKDAGLDFQVHIVGFDTAIPGHPVKPLKQGA